MEIDARPVALAFTGTFLGGFALAIACLAGDGLAAALAAGMTAFCGAEFARTAERASFS